MAVSKLGLRDLNCVRQELHSVKEKWLDLGIELHASSIELRKIAETHKQDYSNCLNLMLMQWLESGDASWKILCEVLKSRSVNESKLSGQLEERYCNKNSSETGISKLTKRAHSDYTSAPKTKQSRVVPLPAAFAPEDFLRRQPPDRICYKCMMIPRTPLHPECCNTKLYCEPCSKKVKMCSTHQMENKFKRDDNFFTLVAKLKIKCPNWREGCEFKETVSKVYREHLPYCTKSTKATGNHKSRSELEEEDVWYLASDEVQPYNSTCAKTKASDSNIPKGPVSVKEIASPAHKRKPIADGQALPTLTSSQHQHKSSSATTKSVVPPQESADSTANVQTLRQKAKCQIDGLITQKFYGGKQPSLKMVGCNSGSSDCKILKIKTEVKQESPIPQSSLSMQLASTQQAQVIKQEQSSFGSGGVLQPCEYKAIGCLEMVPKGQMKDHLKESLQHHLDLAIKRILLNATKKEQTTT